MKRLAFLLMAVSLAVVACGDGGSSGNPTPRPEPTMAPSPVGTPVPEPTMVPTASASPVPVPTPRCSPEGNVTAVGVPGGLACTICTNGVPVPMKECPAFMKSLKLKVGQKAAMGPR